jgi:hypothetical protein
VMAPLCLVELTSPTQTSSWSEMEDEVDFGGTPLPAAVASPLPSPPAVVLPVVFTPEEFVAPKPPMTPASLEASPVAPVVLSPRTPASLKASPVALTFSEIAKRLRLLKTRSPAATPPVKRNLEELFASTMTPVWRPWHQPAVIKWLTEAPWRASRVSRPSSSATSSVSLPLPPPPALTKKQCRSHHWRGGAKGKGKGHPAPDKAKGKGKKGKGTFREHLLALRIQA